MDKEIFLNMKIDEQVEHVNKRTTKGEAVKKIAGEFGIGEKSFRKIFKDKGYSFSQKEKKYILDNGITQELESKPVEISKENKTGNNGATKVETNEVEKFKTEGRANYFTRQEFESLRELLERKEELLNLLAVPKEYISGNSTVTVIDMLNMDRSNRKKATFNIDVKLLEELEKYNDNPNISKSDIVNQAIKEYLNSQGIIKE